MLSFQRRAAASRLSRHRFARGSFVFEAIAVLSIFIAFGVVQLNRTSQSNDERMAEIAGVYHRRVEKAAQDYVAAHYADLLAAMPAAGATQKVSFATLQSEGFIPTTIAATNPWGQVPMLRLRRGTGTDQIEALVIGEGGTSLADRLARQVARAIGAEGGYTVAAGGYCGTTKVATNVLCGTQGVWTRPVADFAASGSPGHVASALFFLDGMAVNDYLYRKQVPGKPELNTMGTYLQMGSGTIAVENGPCYSVAGDPSSLLLTNGAIGRTANGMLLSCQSGVWARSVRSSGDTMTGRLQTRHDDWSVVTMDGAGSLNAAGQSATGSLNINDAYVRSVGKWLSQINFDGYAGPPGPQGPQGPPGPSVGPYGPVISVTSGGPCGNYLVFGFSSGYVYSRALFDCGSGH
ncbi:shufflon system plasmid conjugative transfer pilus tip adhesin PilV [Castellaniella sp. UC4442_H9]